MEFIILCILFLLLGFIIRRYGKNIETPISLGGHRPPPTRKKPNVKPVIWGITKNSGKL